MQIVVGMGMLEGLLNIKDVGKSKITVLYQQNDTMTIEEHLAIEKMRVKPEFVLSEFDDSEIGWSMTAGQLLEKYQSCVLVTDVESLLRQEKVETRDGRKSLYFVHDLSEAVKTASVNDKKPVRKAKLKTEPKEKPKKEPAEKKPVKKTPAVEEEDDIGLPVEEINTASSFAEPDFSEPEQEEPDFVMPEPEYEGGGYTPEDFKADIMKYGIDESKCETVRAALLDARSVEELAGLLRSKVPYPETVAEHIRSDFSWLKEMAKEAEVNSI